MKPRELGNNNHRPTFTAGSSHLCLELDKCFNSISTDLYGGAEPKMASLCSLHSPSDVSFIVLATFTGSEENSHENPSLVTQWHV